MHAVHTQHMFTLSSTLLLTIKTTSHLHVAWVKQTWVQLYCVEFAALVKLHSLGLHRQIRNNTYM